MGKKFRAALLALILSGNILTMTAMAEELSEEDKAAIKAKQAELAGIKDQMGDKRQIVKDKREKASSAYEELRIVENELAVAEQELSQLQGNLSEVQTKIANNEQFLKESVGRLDERKTAYNKRIRNIYMHGQVNYLDVLLGSRDFTDLTTRFQLLTRIIKNDIDLINKIKDDRADVAHQQEQLTTAQEELEKLRSASLEKQETVAGHRRQRKEVFDAAAAERNQAEREYSELMAISENIANMIRRLESNGRPIGRGTGVMIWPYRGTITSPYGWRVHPIFGTQRMHTGIDIGGPHGDPVVAADEGTVISSGWLGGYGYTVMLDHGGGIVTLYAHNSELLVSEGEKVVKGQTVAYVGATGYATGPHCHFEVRVRGEITNPMDYLP